MSQHLHQQQQQQHQIMMQNLQQQMHHNNSLQFQQFKKDSNFPGLDADDDGSKKKVKLMQY